MNSLQKTNQITKMITLVCITFLTLISCSQDEELLAKIIDDDISESNNQQDSNSDEDTKIDDTVSKELKAFPTAYGAGAYTTGGRGGRVIHVTNLNDSGPGSLREAVMAYGPRIVVFDVSGTIELLTDLNIYEGNLTIAGQTAPSPGITITGRSIKMSSNQWTSADNMIFRYFRIRPDFIRNGLEMGIQLNNAKNIIIDHVSISWAGDKAIGISDVAENVTVQNVLIGESNTGMIVGQNLKGTGYTSQDISVLRNIFYDSSHRFPNPGGEGRFDVINNVGYNYRYRLINVSGNAKINIIGNYYDRGTRTPVSNLMHKVSGTLSPVENMEVFLNGNSHKNYSNANDWNMWTAHGGGTTGWLLKGISYKFNDPLPEKEFKTEKQFSLIGAEIEILKSENLIDELIKNIGANKSINGNGTTIDVTDSIDKRYLTAMANRTYTEYEWNEDWATYPHYIEWHSSVSKTPIKTRPSNYDTDGDGMPDEWEKVNGFDPNTNDSSLDKDSDGYTNIEEFLNSVDN